jgi:hypothetical protein
LRYKRRSFHAKLQWNSQTGYNWLPIKRIAFVKSQRWISHDTGCIQSTIQRGWHVRREDSHRSSIKQKAFVRRVNTAWRRERIIGESTKQNSKRDLSVSGELWCQDFQFKKTKKIRNRFFGITKLSVTIVLLILRKLKLI